MARIFFRRSCVELCFGPLVMLCFQGLGLADVRCTMSGPHRSTFLIACEVDVVSHPQSLLLGRLAIVVLATGRLRR
jgi:hypothetical protein